MSLLFGTAWQTAAEPSDDAWPRTKRIVPWLVAGFIAMLWLIPFNSVQLAMSLPIDLQLDRLVLPLIFCVWLAAAAVGALHRPWIELTPIHLSLVALVGVAVASILLNFETLSIGQEFGLATKKLLLLASYALFFVLVASVVRPAEVRAFMHLTVGLACVAAAGTIYEYRTDANLFYEWTAAILPDQFRVATPSADGKVDALGRRLIQGPTQHGLEIATLLAMALPLAMVGLIGASSLRRRALYGLVVALLFAGSVSTYRKTAIIAPAAGLVAITLFRPVQMIKLLPLGAVIVVGVHFLSPGALGSSAVQLLPERFDSATVAGRTTDYDAVRPDVLNHPAFGRGYGTYDPHAYRFLDNEYLLRLLETGFVGMAAYLAVILSVLGVSYRWIRRHDPLRGPPALAAAGAASAFLVASALFDAMSFPHVPYVFLSIAGLAAACVRRGEPAQVPSELRRPAVQESLG